MGNPVAHQHSEATCFVAMKTTSWWWCQVFIFLLIRTSLYLNVVHRRLCYGWIDICVVQTEQLYSVPWSHYQFFVNHMESFLPFTITSVLRYLPYSQTNAKKTSDIQKYYLPFAKYLSVRRRRGKKYICHKVTV